MAVLAKVSTLCEQLPSVIVDLSLHYCCTAHQALAALRSLCTEGSIDVCGRMQCLHVNSYGPQLLYSARNFGHVFFDVSRYIKVSNGKVVRTQLWFVTIIMY